MKDIANPAGLEALLRIKEVLAPCKTNQDDKNDKADIEIEVDDNLGASYVSDKDHGLLDNVDQNLYPQRHSSKE